MAIQTQIQALALPWTEGRLRQRVRNSRDALANGDERLYRLVNTLLAWLAPERVEAMHPRRVALPADPPDAILAPVAVATLHIQDAINPASRTGLDAWADRLESAATRIAENPDLLHHLALAFRRLKAENTASTGSAAAVRVDLPSPLPLRGGVGRLLSDP